MPRLLHDLGCMRMAHLHLHSQHFPGRTSIDPYNRMCYSHPSSLLPRVASQSSCLASNGAVALWHGTPYMGSQSKSKRIPRVRIAGRSRAPPPCNLTSVVLPAIAFICEAGRSVRSFCAAEAVDINTSQSDQDAETQHPQTEVCC